MNFRTWLEGGGRVGYPERTRNPFKGEIFGWITPRGNFYQSEQFQHLESIAKHLELKKLVPFWDREWADLQDRYDSSMQSIDNDEHPEWHGYDMMKDSFEREVVRALYTQGCLRVGSTPGRMFFQGTSQGIQNLHQTALNLAEEYGREAKFEVFNRF